MSSGKLRNAPLQTKTLKFVVDLGVAAQDTLFNPKDVVDFFKSKIKLNGRKGNLKEDVTVALQDKKVVVQSKVALSKRYLKYLTKKFLKLNNVIEYLHVVATDKITYKIKYVNVDRKAEEEAA